MKTKLTSLLGGVFIVLAAALVFMGQQCGLELPIESIMDQEIGHEGNKTPCPKLDTRLYQLTQSENPSEFAEANKLHFSDGKVRVVIVLADTLSIVSSEFHIVSEGQAGNLLQAMVPIDQLCELSEEPYIDFIRPPLQSVSLSGKM